MASFLSSHLTKYQKHQIHSNDLSLLRVRIVKIMGPDIVRNSRHRSNNPYGSFDHDDDDSSLFVLGSGALVAPIKNCGGDIGLLLEGLPDEEDLKSQHPDAVECSFASQADSSMNSSMNSSFCIWDKLNTENSLRQAEETIDALSAVAADGRPMFYQFQDEHEKSISNRSRTCFENGDSKHSTRSGLDNNTNRSTRVRTVVMDDEVVTTTKKKCVQFAENIDGSVKSTTCTYQKVTDPELWWSGEEWALIKKKIRKAVNHHKVHSPKYNESIRGLMYSYRKTATKESNAQHMSHLLECYDSARGLESYIVGHSKALTDAHLDAVLRAQHGIQLEGIEAGSDKGCEEIRKAGKKSSRPARQLALKLAESDTHQALRATLSSWR